MTATAGCTARYAITLIVGIFSDDVFRVTGALMEPGKGGTAVMCNSNSLSGRTVFNSARNTWLVHSRSDSLSGSSRLFTMRTTLVTFVWLSSETLNTVVVGVTSIGFHTVPVICSTTLGLPGSLHVTVADLLTAPPILAELSWRGIVPVLPGSTCLSQLPAVVQPHPGRTSLISSVASPTFVNTKSCRTTSPELTLPKLKTSVANSILGPAVGAGGSGIGEFSVCATPEAKPPKTPATINAVTTFVFMLRY